jgi:ankyrin repeat protein
MSSSNKYDLEVAIKSIKNKNNTPLKRLLELPGLKQKFNPGQKNNLLLILAVKHNNSEAVKLLLRDERIDPRIPDSRAFKDAVKYGYTDIVYLFLQDNRIDPAYQKNYAIRMACEKGFIQMTKLLLSDKRVNPQDVDYESLFKAVMGGHTVCVKLLLIHPTIDLTIIGNRVLELAKYKKHQKIIQLLLSHSSMNQQVPNVNNKLTDLPGKCFIQQDLIKYHHIQKNITNDKTILEKFYGELLDVCMKYTNGKHHIECYEESNQKKITICF